MIALDGLLSKSTVGWKNVREQAQPSAAGIVIPYPPEQTRRNSIHAAAAEYLTRLLLFHVLPSTQMGFSCDSHQFHPMRSNNKHLSPTNINNLRGG